MNFDFNNIAPYISYMLNFYSIIEISKKVTDKAKKEYQDKEIDVYGFVEMISNEDLIIGNTVSVTGFMLDYAQIVQPYTYVNSVWKPSSKSEADDFNIIHKGTIHELKKEEILFQRNQILLPVQSMPSQNNISIGFLYDERFTTFLYSNNPEKIKAGEEPYVKGKYSDPILVLYDKNKHSNIINKYLYIKKAKVIFGNDDVNEYIKTKTTQELCLSNIYRPIELKNEIVCLSLLNDECKIEIIEGASRKLGEDFSFPIYVEGTFNSLYNIKSTEVIKLIESIAPDSMKYKDALPSLRDEMDNAVSFISTSNINITYREPGTIGFYTISELFNKSESMKTIDDLATTINNFAIDYKNISKKQFGVKDYFNLTFIYDYRYKNLFSTKNVDISFNNVKESEKIKKIFKSELEKFI